MNLWASNATQSEAIASGLPGAKIVPGAFNNERSSVALPKGRSLQLKVNSRRSSTKRKEPASCKRPSNKQV